MHRFALTTHFRTIAIAVAVLSLGGVAGGASGATITVCLDGTCDFTSPAAAVAAAAEGDTIEIAAGTYLFSGPIDNFGKDLVIRGAVDAEGRPATVFDGQDSTTLLGFWFVTAATRVENIVLANGHAEYASALRVDSSSGVTFRNCVLRDNRSQFAGAMMVFSASVTMIGCEIVDNAGYHPGQSAGAGIRVSSGTLTLIDSAVTGNAATNIGGGIFLSSQGIVKLDSSRVCGNTAPNGPQIGMNPGGTVTDLGGACVMGSCDDCPTPAPCPADLDGDGAVGAADLSGLLAAWGGCPKKGCAADLDGNGSVGSADLAILLGAWGGCD
jgi:hypothetical protein